MSDRKFFTEELETHLNYDCIDKCWYAETNIIRDYKKFKEQNWTVIDEQFFDDGSFMNARFKCERYKGIRICSATKREYTEEKMKELRERMLRMRERRMNNNEKEN